MMNINTSKAIVTTNRFEQLQKKLNSEFYHSDDIDIQIHELKKAMDELLTILSDICQGG